MLPFGLGFSREVDVTSTADGVTARLAPRSTDTFSMVTGFFRDDFGSDTDGTGSGYGLAHALSSSTAPGRESGEKALGDGVAPVTKTAGGRDWSLSRVPVGGRGGSGLR